MAYFTCPYLGSIIELTDERERHIADHHPDLLPGHWERIAKTLSEPDQIRRSSRFSNARMFSRRFESLLGGKYVIVVVVSDSSLDRNWIVTAYIARKLAKGGDIEWKRD